MKIEKGIRYILCGKLGNMKRFSPVSGCDFVVNKIHAEIFSPMTDADVQKLEKELYFLSNQGEFEYRRV